MNEDIERSQRVNDLADALINDQHVSRWDIMPFRYELREKLQEHEDALYTLEYLIESALESL